MVRATGPYTEGLKFEYLLFSRSPSVPLGRYRRKRVRTVAEDLRAFLTSAPGSGEWQLRDGLDLVHRIQFLPLPRGESSSSILYPVTVLRHFHDSVPTTGGKCTYKYNGCRIHLVP
jgi:hypothetical protein